MAISVPQTKENLAIAYGGYGTFISVHTADPGTTGANEATGGSPAYARKATVWTGGSVDGSIQGSSVTIDLPAGTYAWLGIWSAVTGGTFVDKIAVASTTLGAQGQLVVTPAVTVV